MFVKGRFLSPLEAQMSTNDEGSKLRNYSEITNFLSINILTFSARCKHLYIDVLAPCTKKNQIKNLFYQKLFVILRTDLYVMTKKELTKEQEQLARFAKALGHPIRVAILQLLASQTCCFHGDMSEILPVAKSTLSQHLNELKDAGLIQGTFNPPTVKYCINKKNWAIAKRLFDSLLTEISNSEGC